MARIIEKDGINRRIIKLSADDVVSIIQQYQTVTKGYTDAGIVRDLLKSGNFFLPEEI